MTSLPHFRAAMAAQVWALEPSRLNDVMAVVERRIIAGERLTPEEIAAIRGPRDPALPNGLASFWSHDARGVMAARPRDAGGSTAQDGSLIAVISISGIIAQHASQVDDISGPGGTSTERVGASFRAAMADPAVKAIVLNINSPGGTVYGVQPLADEVASARGRKPIVTQANSMAASAAYWIGSAADEVVITPGGEIGSIGTYIIHEDLSKAAEMKGLKVSVIAAGKYKAEDQPFQPLSDDARADKQRRVDSVHSDFLASVARGRGVSVAKVRSDYGKGRMMGARDAVRVGMADRVETLQQTLQRLAGSARGSSPTSSARAQALSPGAAASDEMRRRRFAERAAAPDQLRRRRFALRAAGILQ